MSLNSSMKCKSRNNQSKLGMFSKTNRCSSAKEKSSSLRSNDSKTISLKIKIQSKKEKNKHSKSVLNSTYDSSSYKKLNQSTKDISERSNSGTKEVTNFLEPNHKRRYSIEDTYVINESAKFSLNQKKKESQSKKVYTPLRSAIFPYNHKDKTNRNMEEKKKEKYLIEGKITQRKRASSSKIKINSSLSSSKKSIKEKEDPKKKAYDNQIKTSNIRKAQTPMKETNKNKEVKKIPMIPKLPLNNLIKNDYYDIDLEHFVTFGNILYEECKAYTDREFSYISQRNYGEENENYLIDKCKTKVEKIISHHAKESINSSSFNFHGIQKTSIFSFNIPDLLYQGKLKLIGITDGIGFCAKTISQHTSNYLPKYIEKELIKIPMLCCTSSCFLDELYSSIKTAYQKFNQALKKNLANITKHSGSTCCTLLMTDKRIITISLGDCKAIIFKKLNKKWDSEILSDEHIPINKEEAKRIESCGGIIKTTNIIINPLFNDKHSEESNFANKIKVTRCFGNFHFKDYGILDEPSFKEYFFKEEDKIILLGNSYFWNILKMKDIQKICSYYYENKDVEGCLKKLKDLIRKEIYTQNEMIINIYIIFLDDSKNCK
ncbi:MAG: protein phosphatase 2C domain-containing protein [archaeon]|nr:protein phosphatase 2C domain-containing protein [archaeon]